ncbi:hypothetical protein FRC03_007248 [Tulasnella sp. 419]|nr:hypothetical protein FRC03_007248 [Tulasnella sp. 419]
MQNMYTAPCRLSNHGLASALWLNTFAPSNTRIYMTYIQDVAARRYPYSLASSSSLLCQLVQGTTCFQTCRLSYSCGGRGAIWLSPFLHGSLDSLVLEIHPSASLHTSPLLLNALSLRATGLRQLQISDGQSLGTESQQVVVSAFEALSKLQHICLPTHYYTPEIFEVLAKHPTIQTITTLPGRPNPTFAISSSNLGPCAGFRSTRFINLVEPAVASRFVHWLSSPSQITAVELSFDFSTVNEDINLISRKCPHLQHFKVTIGNAPETHSSYRFDEAMGSLSRCSELQSIGVTGSRAVTLSEESASLAGFRWKDLQRLILNPVPTCDISRPERHGAGISYETLRNLVESCKVLSHVGVFLGRSAKVIPYKAVQSASLRTLDVGISTLPERNVVQGLLGLSLLDLDIIVFSGQPISISKLEWENITLELARWAMVYQSIHAVRIVMLENNRQAQLLQNHVAFLETWYKKRYSSP